jgi:endonuclease YncB( thermonuclease family)
MAEILTGRIMTLASVVKRYTHNIIISYMRAVNKGLAIIMLLAAFSPVYAEEVVISHVVDGDTVITAAGEKVRLIGIDTTERDEPFYVEGKEALKAMVKGRELFLDRCPEKDKYGRTLGILSDGENNINLAMMATGLAQSMLIPPCGREIAPEILEELALAISGRRGIYSLDEYQHIHHLDAGAHVGQTAVVAGTVDNIHMGKKAIHFNFGQDWRRDFTAVIFKGSIPRFEALGIDPLRLKGKKVLVTGQLKEYNGAEIIVRYPGQLIAAPEEREDK